MNKKKFGLGFYPTPLHKLENLSAKYDDYNVFIKRDDQTGLASRGNKTRKLEYLIQDAIDGGYNTVFTAGAQQSNHCRQTDSSCLCISRTGMSSYFKRERTKRVSGKFITI